MDDAETDRLGSLFSSLESAFEGLVVAPMESLIFFDLVFWDNASGDVIQLPIVVAWLVLGALFFTLRFQFVNIRGFRHGIDCVMGRYSEPGDHGEISHFQALSAALSATVGLGNIAGVAFAIGIGGPGAVFWMWVVAFLGASTAYVESALGQIYKEDDEGQGADNHQHVKVPENSLVLLRHHLGLGAMN